MHFLPSTLGAEERTVRNKLPKRAIVGHAKVTYVRYTATLAAVRYGAVWNLGHCGSCRKSGQTLASFPDWVIYNKRALVVS